MQLDQFKPNVIVHGAIFPEPAQVIVVVPMGNSVKLIGKGLNTGKVHEPILNADQLAGLEATPEKKPFDGDAVHFSSRERKKHSDPDFQTAPAVSQSRLTRRIRQR